MGIAVIITALLLTGCQAVPTFETLGNIEFPQEKPAVRNVLVQLPEEAAVQTMHGDSGTIYLCDGYEIALETLSAGNLDGTLRSLTGFGMDGLTVMQTRKENVIRYECVWTSAGEGGDQIGRTAILDDGAYHYCLSVTAPAEEAGSLQATWQAMFDSFMLG